MPENGRSAVDDVAAPILRQLRRQPFSSVRSLEEELAILHGTIHHHFSHSLGTETRNLKWVPNVLTDCICVESRGPRHKWKVWKAPFARGNEERWELVSAIVDLTNALL
jgi:hypothetical protein